MIFYNNVNFDINIMDNHITKKTINETSLVLLSKNSVDIIS